MKKNFILLLCIISLIAVALASCEKHEHTFSDKWYSDDNNHWHPATCEHAETERSDLAPHTDADENGSCDVCEKTIGHTHTYEDAWSFSDTHHWKNATCSHDDKGSYSAHSDEDVNGSCDVCSAHVHNVNAAGYCKFADCGEKVKEVDENSLDELVAAILVQKYLVNGGTIDYNFEGRSNTSDEYDVKRNEFVNYIFGKDNYTNINVSTNIVNGGVQGTGTFESWHQLVGSETVFGVISENGGDLALDLPEVSKLNGYFIAMSTLVSEYGVEETLYALYEVAISDSTDELEVIPDTAENKVTFKYNYKTVFVNELEIAVGENAGGKIYNVNHFEVEVTFKYNDDFALTDLMILVDCYTNDPGTSQTDGFLYKDVDIQYDPETDSFIFIEYVQDSQGNWVANPTDKRTPDTYVINVTQTVGARTEENPHSKEKFIPSSFDLYLSRDDDTGEISNKYDGSDFKINVRDVINFYVGECYPAGSSLHFAQDMVSIKLFKNNVEIENPDVLENPIAVAEFTLSGERRSFFVIPKEDGAYRFEIYIMNNKVYEITIHAGVVDEEFIDLGDDEFAVKITETYAWTNEVIFTAPEAGTYYFNLPAGVGFINADEYDAAQKTEATDDGPDPYFDYNDFGNGDGGSFSLTLEEGESIRFYVNGTKRGTIVIKYVLF